MLVVNRKKTLLVLAILLLLIIVFQKFQSYNSRTVISVMGGSLSVQSFDEENNIGEENNKLIRKSEDVETYVRPSDLPVLNDRDIDTALDFTNLYYNKNVADIVLPKELMESPEETIINYYSILREAANWVKGKNIFVHLFMVGLMMLRVPYRS